MTYAGFAFLSRQMRSSLLEQIRQDFVRTARAKGLSERVVILRHAVRNALIPIVTLFGNLLPVLIAGSIIIEQLFSIPGMGQLFFTAIQERDYTVIMGIEVVSALMTLFGILDSDILYVVVNPTIAYE
jgi:peptide/nickel transport system permease protein